MHSLLSVKKKGPIKKVQKIVNLMTTLYGTSKCYRTINEKFNRDLTTYFWTFGGLRLASTDLQCRLMLVLELAGDWVI